MSNINKTKKAPEFIITKRPKKPKVDAFVNERNSIRLLYSRTEPNLVSTRRTPISRESQFKTKQPLELYASKKTEKNQSLTRVEKRCRFEYESKQP